MNVLLIGLGRWGEKHLRVDAVDIVTPADSRLAIASMCLAAGRHCFVEKPLTMNAEEGRRLVAAADRAKRVVQVGHIFRFQTAATAVQRDFLGRGLAA